MPGDAMSALARTVIRIARAGTQHRGVVARQLDYYLDEYTFRFNRRTSRSRGLLFYRLLEQAVATEPVTYRDIAMKGG